ncbi:hypothetical protein BGZ61DRAFT_586457 [Ilyonectria robusta]|uniref:uncharacterized protein n=1 Tax=Ilyonectria robusta TaxID=1079257 RepID=UPI001E8ED28C|nr:uncharacterized protein BGZ61DRAFT_586457 [Ilyonectria robusta]KAH8721653.1 hypothetical protein BGZ61DRAFT_586457 [Ilyonectria robusta]
MTAFFDTRYKFPVQLLQLFLVHVVLILSVVRMFNRPAGAPRTRANTMSLGMSAKSLVILLYELLSEHVRAFKKWKSLKAYVILNGLENVFWGAVVFMLIQANIKFCQGINCTLSWVIVTLAIILNMLASYMTVVTWLDFRYFRATGHERGSRHSTRSAAKLESANSDALHAARKSARKHRRDDNRVPMTRQTTPRRESRSGSRHHSKSSKSSKHHSSSSSRRHRDPSKPPSYESHRSQRHHSRRHSGSGQQVRQAHLNRETYYEVDPTSSQVQQGYPSQSHGGHSGYQ